MKRIDHGQWWEHGERYSTLTGSLPRGRKSDNCLARSASTMGSRVSTESSSSMLRRYVGRIIVQSDRSEKRWRWKSRISYIIASAQGGKGRNNEYWRSEAAKREPRGGTNNDELVALYLVTTMTVDHRMENGLRWCVLSPLSLMSSRLRSREK